MTIRLSSELEKQIQERVRSGTAESVQEFVEGAVRHALSTSNSSPRTKSRKSAAELFDEIWSGTPEGTLRRLPEDGADQVDHYVYGVPKR